MPNPLPETPQEVYAGDFGRPFSLLLTKGNMREVQNLTGYFGRILFSYPDADPHAVKAATVDGVNGLLTIPFLEGDEFPTGGSDVYVQVQGEILLPDWYGNVSAKGWAFHPIATDVVTFKVLRRPS